MNFSFNNYLDNADLEEMTTNRPLNVDFDNPNTENIEAKILRSININRERENSLNQSITYSESRNCYLSPTSFKYNQNF